MKRANEKFASLYYVNQFRNFYLNLNIIFLRDADATIQNSHRILFAPLR